MHKASCAACTTLVMAFLSMLGQLVRASSHASGTVLTWVRFAGANATGTECPAHLASRRAFRSMLSSCCKVSASIGSTSPAWSTWRHDSFNFPRQRLSETWARSRVRQLNLLPQTGHTPEPSRNCLNGFLTLCSVRMCDSNAGIRQHALLPLHSTNVAHEFCGEQTAQ